MIPVAAVILCAGKGGRMNTVAPKMMHDICGRPMVRWVTDLAESRGVKPVLVVDANGLPELPFAQVCQPQPKGTVDALLCGLSQIRAEAGPLLVFYGSEPALAGEDVDYVLSGLETMAGSMLQGRGLFAFRLEGLRDALRRALVRFGEQADLQDCDMFMEMDVLESRAGGYPITNLADLAACQAVIRSRISERLMLSGVAMPIPDNVYIETGVTVGAGTVLYPGVRLMSGAVIGRDCVIEGDTDIRNSRIGDGCTLRSVYADGVTVGSGVKIGPFVNLRPGTNIADGAKIGDFVEIKNSSVGGGSKVPHLAYVGDADLGERVNVGCGCVFANYDGVAKHRSSVGNDVFLGCQTNLVSPVSVGDGAYTAAGSTITRDVPAGDLAIARARQENIADGVKKFDLLKGKK